MNRGLAILSGIFRMAVDYEEITENPCRKVESLPENNQRTRHLSFEEEDRLCWQADRRAGISQSHTFGTRLADAGVDVVKIKELMGHASIVITMRYIHATDQGKRGAIVVLSEYRQKRRHKFVADEKRQTLESAVCHC